MYEMEGPRPASPRPASQLPGLADAARRPPGPGTRARGRSPGPFRVPGVAPGWCPFPAVKALLLPQQALHKALRQAISCFPAIHGRLHRKQPVLRISRRLSTVLFTAYPQPGDREPENATGSNRRTRSYRLEDNHPGDRIRCGRRWPGHGRRSGSAAEHKSDESLAPTPARTRRQRQRPVRHAGMAADRRRLGRTGWAVLAGPEGNEFCIGRDGRLTAGTLPTAPRPIWRPGRVRIRW